MKMINSIQYQIDNKYLKKKNGESHLWVALVWRQENRITDGRL